MRSEGGGRAVVIAPSALGSKDHPAGPSKVPLRRIRQAIYPPRRINLPNVEKAPWRVSRHDNLPSSPSMVSRNEVWKTEGVSTFSLAVLVKEHGIHSTHDIITLYGQQAGCIVIIADVPGIITVTRIEGGKCRKDDFVRRL